MRDSRGREMIDRIGKVCYSCSEGKFIQSLANIDVLRCDACCSAIMRYIPIGESIRADTTSTEITVYKAKDELAAVDDDLDGWESWYHLLPGKPAGQQIFAEDIIPALRERYTLVEAKWPVST